MKGMRIMAKRTNTSGMQIYFTMNELSILIDAISVLELEVYGGSDDMEAIERLSDKISRAKVKRSEMNRPLQKYSDI